MSNIREVCFADIEKPTTKQGRLIVSSTSDPSAVYLDVFKEVEGLLSDPELNKYFKWHYEEERDHIGERQVSDMWTGNWWKNQQVQLGQATKILAIIFSMDETPVTYNGRNLHPVYMTLGNIPFDLR